MRTPHKISDMILPFLAIACFLIYMSFGIEAYDTIPNNAIVVYSYSNKTYNTPPCIINKIGDVYYGAFITDNKGNVIGDFLPDMSTVVTTKLKAVAEGGKRDTKCNNASGFESNSFSLMGQLFGFKHRERWNSDGNWNY